MATKQSSMSPTKKQWDAINSLERIYFERVGRIARRSGEITTMAQAGQRIGDLRTMLGLDRHGDPRPVQADLFSTETEAALRPREVSPKTMAMAKEFLEAFEVSLPVKGLDRKSFPRVSDATVVARWLEGKLKK